MDRQTVLIVEDDELIRDMLTELLEGVGYAVLEAEGGAQALRLLTKHVPSVVLLDHNLPDMSALDVLTRLRAYVPARRVPVMLVSGLAHQLAGLDHGADLVLATPLAIADLLEQVGALADHVQLAVA